MTPEFVAGFFFDAIKTAISLAAPMLLAGLAVGLVVSIFQAATSINEMTLTFIPKMLAVAVSLAAVPLIVLAGSRPNLREGVTFCAGLIKLLLVASWEITLKTRK